MKKIKFHSLEEVFKKNNSKKFKLAYEGELARLKLVKQIRETRQTKHLTQKVLAEKAEMPQSVIARIESGRHNPSMETLQRVAQVMGKEIQLV